MIRKKIEYPSEIRDVLIQNNGPSIIEYNDILLSDDKGKNILLSKYNINSFHGLSENELIFIINKEFGIDIRTEEGLNHINYMMNYSIQHFYKGSKRELISEKKGFQIHDLIPINGFSSVNEILSFLQSIEIDREKKNLYKANLKCYISKVSSIVNNLISNDLHKLKDIEKMIFLQLSSILNISTNDNDTYSGRINGHNFKFYGRTKSIQSCILKGLTNVNYTNLEQIKDGIGYTIETENTNNDDIIELLRIIVNSLIAVGGTNLKIKLKGFHELNIENVITDIPIIKEKKEETGKLYEDVKVVCFIDGLIGGVEFKITKRGNLNQVGLQSHLVYKLINIDIIGLSIKHFNDGTISSKEIDDEIKLFLSSLTEEKIRENKEIEDMNLQDYLIFLWRDLQNLGYIKEKNMPLNIKFLKAVIGRGLKLYITSLLNEIQPNIYTDNTHNVLLDNFGK